MGPLETMENQTLSKNGDSQKQTLQEFNKKIDVCQGLSFVAEDFSQNDVPKNKKMNGEEKNGRRKKLTCRPELSRFETVQFSNSWNHPRAMKFAPLVLEPLT